MVDKFKWSAHKNELRDYDSDLTIGNLDEYYASLVSSISGFKIIDSAVAPAWQYRRGPLMSEEGSFRIMKFCNDFETMDRESGEEINPWGRGPRTFSLLALAADGQTIITNVNEGQSFAVKLFADNSLEGQTYDYTITGIQSADINGAPLTGTFTVTDSETDIIYFSTALNDTVESELFKLSLDYDSSVNVLVGFDDITSAVDSWLPMQSGPYNEGSTITFEVQGTALTYPTLYWEVVAGSTIDPGNPVTNFDRTSGTITISSDSGNTGPILILEDETSEGNLRRFHSFRLKDSANGELLASYGITHEDDSRDSFSLFTTSETGIVPTNTNYDLIPKIEQYEKVTAQGYIDSGFDELADSANDIFNSQRFYIFASPLKSGIYNSDYQSGTHLLQFTSNEMSPLKFTSGRYYQPDAYVPTANNKFNYYFNPALFTDSDENAPYGVAYVDVPFLKDFNTEGDAPFAVKYVNFKPVGASNYQYDRVVVTDSRIIDTSRTPSYSITGPSIINEDANAGSQTNPSAGVWRYTIETENVVDGTEVYWKIFRDSSSAVNSLNQYDLHLDEQFTSREGSVIISSNQGTFDITSKDSASRLLSEIDQDFVIRVHKTNNFAESALTGVEVKPGGKIFQKVTMVDTLNNPIHQNPVTMQGIKTIVLNGQYGVGNYGRRIGRAVILRFGNGWWQIGEECSIYEPETFGNIYALDSSYWSGGVYSGTPPTQITSSELNYVDKLFATAPNAGSPHDLFTKQHPVSPLQNATVSNLVSLPPIDVANSTSTLRLYEKQPFVLPSNLWSKDNSKKYIIGFRSAARVQYYEGAFLMAYIGQQSNSSAYANVPVNLKMIFPNPRTTDGWNNDVGKIEGDYAGAWYTGTNSSVDAEEGKYNNYNQDNIYNGLDFADDNDYIQLRFNHLAQDAYFQTGSNYSGLETGQYSTNHFWIVVKSWDESVGSMNSYGQPNLYWVGDTLFEQRFNVLVDHGYNNFPKPVV